MSQLKTKKVRLSNLIAPHFYNLYEDFMNESHSHYWLDGGRGTFKSSTAGLLIVIGMMNDPNANAICTRRWGSNLHDSVYNTIIWAINVLGVRHLWKIPRGDRGASPITYRPYGTKILFYGLDDPEKVKSVKVVKGYLKYSWHEEISQHEDMGVLRNVNQSIRRGSDKNFITFYTYNPPRNKGNWVNEECESMQTREDTFYSHTNWEMIPIELTRMWLGQPFIDDALALKKRDLEAYQHEYLGIPTGYGTGVFKNCEIREITDDEIQMFDNVAGGIDWGFAEDPATFTLSHYDKKRRVLYLYDEVFATGMSNRRLFQEIVDRGCQNILIVADSAETKSIAEMRDLGLNQIIGAKKGQGSVEFGTKFLQDLEAIVIDKKRCPNTAREFLNAEYAVDKFGNVLPKLADKNNHITDAVRYRMELESKVTWGWS